VDCSCRRFLYLQVVPCRGFHRVEGLLKLFGRTITINRDYRTGGKFKFSMRRPPGFDHGTRLMSFEKADAFPFNDHSLRSLSRA
jgi:hypothetical protein